jgi:hypothetical protein
VARCLFDGLCLCSCEITSVYWVLMFAIRDRIDATLHDDASPTLFPLSTFLSLRRLSSSLCPCLQLEPWICVMICLHHSQCDRDNILKESKSISAALVRRESAQVARLKLILEWSRDLTMHTAENPFPHHAHCQC